MHELSLVQSLAELAIAEATRLGAVAISRLHLRLGSLAGVDPEALRLAGEVICSSGPLAGAHLEIEIIQATALCSPCQAPFAVVDGLCLCPRCGHVSHQLLRGRELELSSLELRLPAEPSQECPADGSGEPQPGPPRPPLAPTDLSRFP